MTTKKNEESQALALIPENAPLALRAPERAAAALAQLQDMGVDRLKLPQLTVPTGGITSWAVRTLAGEDMVKELTGVLAFIKAGERIWYKDSFEDGGGSPPSCVSHNGRTGFGRRNPDLAEEDEPASEQECATCKWSAFGSKRGKGDGQDCRQIMHLYLLREKSLLPTCITVPPTSLKAVQSFAIDLVSEDATPQSVEVGLSLEKARSKGGIDYAVIKLRVVRTLSAVEQERAVALAGPISAFVLAGR